MCLKSLIFAINFDAVVRHDFSKKFFLNFVLKSLSTPTQFCMIVSLKLTPF